MPALKRSDTHIIPNDDGESIDIANISETSSMSSSDSEDTPAVRRPGRTATVVAPAQADTVTRMVAIDPAAGILAPLLPSAPTARTNRAYDVDYFFARGSKTEGTSTICKPCR